MSRMTSNVKTHTVLAIYRKMLYQCVEKYILSSMYTYSIVKHILPLSLI